MAEIKILNKETIDQIAAGEVVERPASVVKELLENAVDAGASAVTVEIKEGGISLIRVTDNGWGIEKSQVAKAFLRHATSKITSAADLSHIASLGFRGEALSSIAAVSQMELVTKTREELTGLRYLIEGGEEKEWEEVGAPEGTTFIVRNLFFNTPVRKKFLKQPQTEGGYVSDLMEHMALSHPHIAFKYTNNGQLRFHTSGNGSLKEIIYRIYGKDISAALLPIDIEENGIRMQGFLGKPEINRANRNYEIYFVNGRFIKSKVMSKAIEEGYRKYVMQHKFPFVVLHFTIAAQDIDVNVHPTKMEIRFTNQSRLYDFIADRISSTLQSQELISEVTLGNKELPAAKEQTSLKIPEPFERQRAGKTARAGSQVSYWEMPLLTGCLRPASAQDKSGMVAESIPSLSQSQLQTVASGTEDKALGKSEQETFIFEDNRNRPNKQTAALPEDNQKKAAGQEAVEAEGCQSSSCDLWQEQLLQNPEQLSFFEERMLTQKSRKEYQILGQLFDTYWLIGFQDKLFIMDQHAAHEKVKYEALLQQIDNKGLESQLLNPPIILTLSAREESVYQEYDGYFKELGFEIEAFGGKEYALRGIPTDLYGRSGGEMFQEILDELSEGPVRGTPEVIRNRLASMACKAAVKGNMGFDRPGIEALIDQLLCLQDPYHCPHGRPTIISMTKYEIEKKFKRIV